MRKWKSKGPALTPEELIAKARKELAPRWSGSPPLFVPVPSEQGNFLFPLNSEFPQKRWLCLVADPFSYEFQPALAILHQYASTYRDLGLLPLIILNYPSGEPSPELLERALSHSSRSIVVHADIANGTRSTLNVTQLPSLLLLEGTRVVHTVAGLRAIELSEAWLQDQLRAKDPGVALPIPSEDLGTPEPTQGGAHLSMNFPDGGEPEGLKLIGPWKLSGKFRVPLSSECEILLKTSCGRIGVAAASSQLSEPTRVRLEIEGAPVAIENLDSALELQEDGSFRFSLEVPRLYRLFRGTPAPRALRFRFAEAPTTIEVYGLTLCNPA